MQTPLLFEAQTVQTRVFLTNVNGFCFLQVSNNNYLEHDLGQVVSNGMKTHKVPDSNFVCKEKVEQLKYYPGFVRKLFYLVSSVSTLFYFNLDRNSTASKENWF